MTATEQWIFLCAAHKTPKECPAIDYTRHTLDGAACLLNSNKYFPSRVSIKESSVAKLGSVCRRIYRIFSHAYFHHRQLFDEYENETLLCHRFTKQIGHSYSNSLGMVTIRATRPIVGGTTHHNLAAIRSPNLRECCNTDVQTPELR
uniref:MOB family member 4, phocein n=1 Tax=Eptatretus burgeri TaxID=7764 RepID=A0A8C4X0X6_EPTBU